MESTKSKFNFPKLIKLNKYQKNLNVLFREKASMNNNFIINLKLSSQQNLIIEFYSEENPTNLYFRAHLTLNDLNNMHPCFHSYTNINDIYELINNMLNRDKYDIKFENNTNISNVILILLNDKEEIKIKLNKEKISFENNNLELNEFIGNFYQDFINLKKIVLNPKFKVNNNNDEIKKLKEENKQIKSKIKVLSDKNNKLKIKLIKMQKILLEIKQSNNTPIKISKNYPKKEDLINSNISNNNQININYDYENNHNINNINNASQYYNNYMSPYYNNNGLNYHHNYLDYLNSNIHNIDEMNDFSQLYYDNGDGIEDIKEEEEDDEDEDEEEDDNTLNNINNVIFNDDEEKYNNIYDYDEYNYDDANYENYHNDMNWISSYPNIYENNNININNDIEDKNGNQKTEEEKIIKLDIADFNKKYQTQYKDNQTKKLELGSRNLGNNILSDILKYDFNNLIKIYLC